MDRDVDWWAVHLYVTAAVDAHPDAPIAGTPAWCALPDDDPRKLAALLDAAQHWALRMETCQAEQRRAKRWAECATRHAVIRKKLAEYQASHAISAAEDWAPIAQYNYNHATFYAAHPWLKRAAP